MRPFLLEKQWVGCDLPLEQTITLASPPFVIHRNYKAHNVHSYLLKALKPSSVRSGKASSAKSKQPVPSQQVYLAQQQTIFYADQVSDSHIPLGLLEITLHGDIYHGYMTRQSASHVCRSSLLQVKHNNDFHGVLGVSGEHLDELTLRNSSFLQPQLDWSSSPGFHLMLSHGSPIRQLIHVGYGCYGLNSNILACTVGEVFYLQAVDSESNNFCPMLEQKGKWQLPNEILTMESFGPHQSSVHAMMITRYGDLYSWSPHRGVLKEQQQVNQFNPNRRLDHNSTVLEFSSHPRVLYLAVESSTLSQIDLRSKGRHIKNTFGEQQRITAICQHRRFEHQYMASAGQILWLMDNRYERQCLYSRHVGVSYHHIEFQSLHNNIDNVDNMDLFLCRSREHDSLHLHNLDTNFSQSSSSSSCQLSHWNSSQTLADLQHIPQRWNTTSFPVVDSDLWCIGSTCILPRIDTNSMKAEQPEQWTEEMRQEAERYSRRRYDGIVVQQNATGDIFAQRLKFTRNIGDEQDRQNGQQKACNTTEMDVESLSTIECENDDEIEQLKVGKDLDNDRYEYSLISDHSKNTSESQQSKDSDDDQSTVAELPSHTAANGTLIKAYKNYPQFPVVQMNLVVGSSGVSSHNSLSFRQEIYLAFARPGGHKMDNRTWLRSFNPLLYHESSVVRRFLRESSKLHPGVILTNTLHPMHDFVSNTSLTTSKQYRQYLPEDSMQGCSVFLFFPQDMRRDWKEQLQLPPTYTLLQRGFEEISFSHNGEDELQQLLLHYCVELAESWIDYPLSLWEIWHGLLHKYQRKVPLDLLRRSLQDLIGAEGEKLLPSRVAASMHELFSAYSDGLYVEQGRRQRGSEPFTSRSNKQISSSSNGRAEDHGDDGESYGCQCNKDQLWKSGNLSRGCGRRDCILPHFLTYQLNEPQNVAGQTPIKSSQHSQQQQMTVKKGTDVTPLTRDAVLDGWDEMASTLFA